MALFKILYSAVLIIQVALTLAMVHAQDDQSGFISIDCGIPEGTKYTDNKTGINYVLDAGFIDSGINLEILSIYKYSNLDYQLNTVRSFPENTRNCYMLKPVQGKGNRYKDDKYDRIWNPGYPSFEYADVKVSRPNNLEISTMENIPSKVLITAVTPAKATDDILYSWTAINKTEEFLMYLYVVEGKIGNQTREFNVYADGVLWDGPNSSNDYDVMTWFVQFSGSLSHELKIRETKRSTLPPMVNALELFKLVHL
ncbi:putative leucine-rich repeat receptor-like protein kinase At2g19210 [Bidens hawaiensis]|uniref:putative leucine-rich repeat receptor-like protein kinase At2g19210 n=1 Tax=Bidens hawaiensis TaxID=980011 RepID=UPI00404B3779